MIQTLSELISLESVVKNNERGEAILKGITAKVNQGEFITIIGPSGSGKSTLLSLLNRMVDPDYGLIRYKGKNYKEIDILLLRKIVGMVFQQPTMLKGTVKDNLLIGPKLHNEFLNEEELDNLLKSVGLPPSIKDQDAKLLSGGQKQKVSLARTLANKSEVLLLDEVTASLDPDSTLEIEHLIQKLHNEYKKTILWITHNISQARRMGQYTWVVANGELIEQGLTKDILKNPIHEITKRFIFST